MRNSSSRHPDDETLETYAAGKAVSAQLARMKEHLLVCPTCQDRLADLDVFLAATREATASLLNSLSHTHVTSDGPVQLVTTRLPRHQWLALFHGQDPDGQSTFDSLQQACDLLRRSFSKTYSEHSCTPLCRKEGH